MHRKIKGKTVEHLGEFGLIREIKKWLPTMHKGIKQGIGDDAAVISASGNKYQLLTIDTIVEDVDFIRNRAAPREIGWKALAVNLSDIAAMGGEPKLALVSLTLPTKTSAEFVKGFYKGLGQLASKFGVSIVGGDLSRGSKISSSVAVLGEVKKKELVLRQSAKVGDFICVSGRLGGSILGKHLNFMPRIREGRLITKFGASAMIDLSDGLGQDLNHLLPNSRTAFMIDERKVPVSQAARRLARGNAKKALIHAFSDGEDFELLFTIAPQKFQSLKKVWARRFTTPLTVIGRVVKWRVGNVPGQNKSLGYHHF
ncbi:MAG: thiamine-monophosphate kinase [Candidatus Omnitrophica bacterium]|nr:thiamine-monophosphate kinase [Candidatus Omnitrophota bacterium]